MADKDEVELSIRQSDNASPSHSPVGSRISSYSSSSSSSSSSGENVDFNPNDSNQKFFDLSCVQPLDLKSKWLCNTEEAIRKFDQKYSQVQHEMKGMETNLKIFDENQNRYRLSSLRKIVFSFDREAYIKNSRRKLEQLQPSLILNILSYAYSNTYLGVLKMRRVSRIFNCIYLNEGVKDYFAEKDLGDRTLSVPYLHATCQKYAHFHKTMLYYKDIQYTEDIPNNSFKEDLYQAVLFINEIHRRVYTLKNPSIGFFELMNSQMRRHRLVIGLISLSMTSLVLIRKIALIAYSNYLAFNPQERRRDHITKTKHSHVVKLVENEFYKDSLFINTQISNFLWQRYAYEFSVYINPSDTAESLQPLTVFHVVYYRHRGQASSFLEMEVLFEDGRAGLKDIEIVLTKDMQECSLMVLSQGVWSHTEMAGSSMPAVLQESVLTNCYIYRAESVYLILVGASLSK